MDHSSPSFKTIKDNFLKDCKENIPIVFEKCPKYKLTIFRDEDVEFKNKWRLYHNDISKFQILCRKCNLLKM